MVPRKKACCCNATEECRDPAPCGVLAATICIADGDACAVPPPEVALAIGPGSTMTVSCDAKFVQQDARLYSTASPTPTDPGAFPDDPDFDDCSWTHPYSPASNRWLRGRKLCKTVLRFEDVIFTWQEDPRTCSYRFCALGVECEVGVAASIVAHGTEEVGGTVAWKQEPDATETMTLDLYLGFVGDILWCPGEDAGNFILGVTAYRTDGEPFALFFNAEWLDDDGIIGVDSPHPDTLEFPAVDDPDTTGTNEAHAWPFLTAVPGGIASDRSWFTVQVTLRPYGPVRDLAGNGTRTTVPTQSHGPIDEEPYIGVCSTTDPWQTITGRTALVLSDRTCIELTDCATCNDSEWHDPLELACVGKTITATITTHSVDPAPLCASADTELIEASDSVTLTLKLKCEDDELFLEWDWIRYLDGAEDSSGSAPNLTLGVGSSLPSAVQALLAPWIGLSDAASTGGGTPFPGPGCTRPWELIFSASSIGALTPLCGAPAEGSWTCDHDFGPIDGESGTAPETIAWSTDFCYPSNEDLAEGVLSCGAVCAGVPGQTHTITIVGMTCVFCDVPDSPFDFYRGSEEFPIAVYTLVVI